MGRRAKYDEDVRTRIPSDWRTYLEREAYERSEPGNKVTPSDLVREAILNHFDDLEEPANAEAD